MTLLLTEPTSDSLKHQNNHFHNLMQQAVGTWQSNRVYESVKTGKVVQVSSLFTVTFNETEQAFLAELHNLDSNTFPHLMQVEWKSHDVLTGQALSEGKMLMGYHDGLLGCASG
ncbi:phycobiliprotein lyase [Leptothermofonsia sp. ETS-13]|uniref:phycobiliprotein lyase n=1 Tax=Leptothermofonsia sp. ETS-13 TaxID=3035696 RepID=UPI003BA2D10F